MSIVIETTIGDITVDLFLKRRPRACQNFMKLCKLKYYNFNLFHTIERNFIAQTGDPTGVADGGSSIWGVIEGPDKRFFEAESVPKIRHTQPGLLSLVSVGKGMVGSQFFFTLGSDLTSLDGIHCVIGEVVEGHDVLRKLNESIVDDKFRPYQDVRITHTVILEDPYEDPRGFRVPDRSPSPNPERLKNGRIGADEDIDDAEGKTSAEIQEMLEEREAKARATILEIVGDLPDAECAPPENVLFVCKLNPVTTDDDLEIIFSRFGKVVSCEVIRDRQTKDSLQYAFVEFENEKSCEAAYFKMDNVLIDDRRIHVDFSQSVSRVQWKGKGRGIVEKGKLDFNDLRNAGVKPPKIRDNSKGFQRPQPTNGKNPFKDGGNPSNGRPKTEQRGDNRSEGSRTADRRPYAEDRRGGRNDGASNYRRTDDKYQNPRRNEGGRDDARQRRSVSRDRYRTGDRNPRSRRSVSRDRKRRNSSEERYNDKSRYRRNDRVDNRPRQHVPRDAHYKERRENESRRRAAPERTTRRSRSVEKKISKKKRRVSTSPSSSSSSSSSSEREKKKRKKKRHSSTSSSSSSDSEPKKKRKRKNKKSNKKLKKKKKRHSSASSSVSSKSSSAASSSSNSSSYSA